MLQLIQEIPKLFYVIWKIIIDITLIFSPYLNYLLIILPPALSNTVWPGVYYVSDYKTNPSPPKNPAENFFENVILMSTSGEPQIYVPFLQFITPL